MQDLMAGLPGSQPINPLSPTVNPLINPQIDRKQLAGDVADVKDAKNQKLAMMLYALGGALKGDKNFVQNTMALEQMQEGKKKKEERNKLLKQFAQDPANKQKMPWLEDVYTLLGDKASDTIADNIVKSYSPISDDSTEFERNTSKLLKLDSLETLTPTQLTEKNILEQKIYGQSEPIPFYNSEGLNVTTIDSVEYAKDPKKVLDENIVYFQIKVITAYLDNGYQYESI